jgi:hypothetical protein
VAELLLLQIVAQDHRTVVEQVMGTIEEGHRAAPRRVEDGFPGGRVRLQLLAVSPSKLLPAFHSMVKPLAELRAGCKLFHPRVRRERFLLHASRP